MSGNPTLEAAANEVALGRLWRAKEILSGRIGSDEYSSELLAAYGRVLAQMNDSKEAGKYLFLSGLADERERDLVALYLESIQGKPHAWIKSQFPTSVRRLSSEEYPPNVYSRLIELGFPKSIKGTDRKALPSKNSKGLEILGVLLVFLFLGTVAVGFFHGVYVLGRWLFGS